MGLGIKKGDTVLVTTGKEKGKKGRVLSVMLSKDKLIIEKVNIIKKHMKPSKKYSQGGIIEKEAPVHISNVMLVCPRCSKPARIANTAFDGGKKSRVCKKCKETIDQ
ncbi:MAG: large subunit ribosomal protein L24 [Nitrospirae bacterium]|nr:MAG: large subunit ribosomal protein L24 [Nitrospirota bacterium]